MSLTSAAAAPCAIVRINQSNQEEVRPRAGPQHTGGSQLSFGHNQLPSLMCVENLTGLSVLWGSYIDKGEGTQLRVPGNAQ